MRRKKLLQWALVFCGCPVFNSHMWEAPLLKKTKGVSHSSPWPCHQLRLHLSVTPTQAFASWATLANPSHQPREATEHWPSCKCNCKLLQTPHTQRMLNVLVSKNNVNYPINNSFILITRWKVNTLDTCGLRTCIKIIQLAFYFSLF